ncbi:hypothetical protein DSO57_1026799 [Entomophthora muscae]|uniref:Uncharacterized protein n=1 Tax=Entomophthora muscae TaxID=34485 RepID=A0ACC2TE58_9FUNG|nr:hypothetical protein DSO57_1026799 [Entomophthora muscae]
MAEAKIARQCTEEYYDSVERKLCQLTARAGFERRGEILECKSFCQTLACKRHCDFIATGYDANVFMTDFFSARSWERCGNEFQNITAQCNKEENLKRNEYDIESTPSSPTNECEKMDKLEFVFSCLANATQTSVKQLKSTDDCTLTCKPKTTIHSYSACFGNCTKDMLHSLNELPAYRVFKTNPNTTIFHPPLHISGSCSFPQTPLLAIFLATIYFLK